MERINRKKFFKLIGSLLMIPAAYFWVDSSRKSMQAQKGKKLLIGRITGEGVYFHGPVILIKSKDQMRVFSSGCTHLGCRINETEGEKLICPCHGSAYNLQGLPVKGPAGSPLKELAYDLTEDGQISIKLY